MIPINADNGDTEVRRVLIVDDHELLRRGLAQLIESEPDLRVCGEAPDAPTALRLVEAENPDLMIVDLSLGESHGLELIRQVKARFPDLGMLVLSMHDEKLYAERCLRAGALGYVQKKDAGSKVIEAMRKIAGGEVYVSDQMTGQILQRLVDRGSGSEAQQLQQTLSDRELQLLELIGQGLTTKQIADRLSLSTKTVDTYREHLKAKLNLGNIYQLVRYAVAWTLENS